METDLYFWTQSKTTKFVLQKLREKIEEAQKDVLDGRLIVSPALEREYCRAIGYIDGLKFIENFIEEAPENELRESTETL